MVHQILFQQLLNRLQCSAHSNVCNWAIPTVAKINALNRRGLAAKVTMVHQILFQQLLVSVLRLSAIQSRRSINWLALVLESGEHIETFAAIFVASVIFYGHHNFLVRCWSLSFWSYHGGGDLF